ncbi:MAG: hypothetical protein ACI4WH_05850 [Oscillospiraceae bacterium]
MKNSDEIWWTGVIGASEYINCIEQSLEEKNSVLLFIPQHIPWHDCFIRHVKLDNPNRNIMSFNLIDCSKILENNLGLMLLNRYGSNEQKSQYKHDIPIGIYLFDNKILNNRTIWFYNIPERLENRWITFLCEFQRRKLLYPNVNNTILCMEIDDAHQRSVNSPFTDTIIWNKQVFDYDVLMFAMHRVRNINEPESIKKYVSQLASSIASSDIELCDSLITRYYDLIRFPEETVQTICNMIYNNSNASIFNMTKRKFDYIVWSAQEQVLFPIIERERLNFINKYYDVVNKNFKNPEVKGNGGDYESPYDVELGALVHICNRRFQGTEIIRNNNIDWDTLKSLHEARNKIAHRTPIKDFKLFNEVLNAKFID